MAGQENRRPLGPYRDTYLGELRWQLACVEQEHNLSYPQKAREIGQRVAHLQD